jgi:DNA-damage-inducible protein D
VGETIVKVKTACDIFGHNVSEHFTDVGKMVKIGSGTTKEIVRETLLSRGIIPENLLPEEDVKKVERKLNSESKKALSNI